VQEILTFFFTAIEQHIHRAERHKREADHAPVVVKM
jgi:hypothetical protein